MNGDEQFVELLNRAEDAVLTAKRAAVHDIEIVGLAKAYSIIYELIMNRISIAEKQRRGIK